VDYYFYYQESGNYFRRRADSRRAEIDDIFMGDGWEPYRGDRSRRYRFGNRVELANLPVSAGGEGKVDSGSPAEV